MGGVSPSVSPLGPETIAGGDASPLRGPASPSKPDKLDLGPSAPWIVDDPAPWNAPGKNFDSPSTTPIMAGQSSPGDGKVPPLKLGSLSDRVVDQDGLVDASGGVLHSSFEAGMMRRE